MLHILLIMTFGVMLYWKLDSFLVVFVFLGFGFGVFVGLIFMTLLLWVFVSRLLVSVCCWCGHGLLWFLFGCCCSFCGVFRILAFVDAYVFVMF